MEKARLEIKKAKKGYKEDIVKSVLQMPDEIRQGKMDKEVFLYYKQFDRLY